MPQPISLPDAPEALPGHVFVQEPDGAEAAVVFIHGLGGDLFTTWGRRGEPGTFLTRAAGPPFSAAQSLCRPMLYLYISTFQKYIA